MNQEHLQQQPAADAYVIGGPSEFAEDLSPSGPGWKADLGADGNTKRNEIGFPEFRKDTFSELEESPGASPSRQASVRQIHAKAEVAAKVARLMLSKTASEMAIENQALVLMDLPLSNLKNTYARLAQDQGEDADEDEDEGQQKEAAEDDDEDEDEGQAKQAKDLPPEFLENIKKKKDEAKDKDWDKGKGKEARRFKAEGQQDDDDDDDSQQKQARRVRAQDQDDDDDGQQKQARRFKAQGQQQDDDDDSQQKQARRVKGQQQDQDDDEGQQKQARRVKGQQQDQDEDDGQQKQARRFKAQEQQDDDDEGQQKQARRVKGQQQDQDDDDQEKVGKEAYSLIQKAASDLLALPTRSRKAVFKVMLPSLAKIAAFGMEQQGQQEQLGADQLQAQVQQMVQQAMQQQQQGQQQQEPQAQPQVQQAQQQEPMLADEELVDQMLQDEPPFGEDEIEMSAPDMDLGMGGDEDPALQAIFASGPEVQRAMEARSIERGHQPTATRTASTRTASKRTASTRTVGTRPSAGVSQLGGATAGSASGAEEINKLASMWSSAPDVSNVFRS